MNFSDLEEFHLIGDQFLTLFAEIERRHQLSKSCNASDADDAGPSDFPPRI